MTEPGFLFDNDGVLMDSSKLHWQSWQLLQKEMPAFHITHEQFIASFGKMNDAIIKELLPQSTKEERQQLANRKEELFRQVAKSSIQLLDGMEQFLKDLKKRNVPRIIASSTPIANLTFFLKETLLGNYFDKFVSGEEVAHGKPAPDVFIEAARRIGYAPKDCIALEDSLAGLEAAKKAGCFVIALATTHPPEKLRYYDTLVASPKELDYNTIMSEWKR